MKEIFAVNPFAVNPFCGCPAKYARPFNIALQIMDIKGLIVLS